MQCLPDSGHNDTAITSLRINVVRDVLSSGRILNLMEIRM